MNSQMKLYFALTLILTNTFACSKSASSKDEIQITPENTPDIQIKTEDEDVCPADTKFALLFSKHKIACNKENGQWYDSLFLCQCPKGKFYSDEHCIDIKESSNECKNEVNSLSEDSLKSCIKDRFSNKALKLYDLDIQTAKNLFKNNSHDLARKLNIPKNSPSIFLSPPATDILSVEDLMTLYPSGKAIHVFPYTSTDEYNATEWKQSCESITSLIPFPSVGLCNSLDEVIDTIRLPEIPLNLAPEQTIQNEAQCIKKECRLVADYSRNEYEISYRNYISHETSYRRMITLESKFFVVLVFLDPEGIPIASVIKFNDFDETTPSIFHHHLFFDYKWSLLGQTKTLKINEDDTQHALQRLFQGHEEAYFPFERPEENIYSKIPLTALVMETSLDVRHEGFKQRLLFDEKSSSQILNVFNPHHHHTLLDYNYLSPQSSSGWFGSGVFGGGDNHGTAISALVLKNLRNVRIALSHRNDLDRLRIDLLNIQPRVVNMSYESLRSSCKRNFSDIFSKFPNTIFVVGVGNDGILDAETCPAILGQNFKNVLTVAGSDDPYTLAEGSNGGRKLAKIAAPFQAWSLNIESPESFQGSSLKECSGTSFSAALVSNAALKFLARRPQTTAEELVDIFTKSCKGKIPDVMCGGTLDFERLENWDEK